MDENYISDDEVAYADLITKVAEINQEAAEYMATDALELDSFDYSGNLCECFLFYQTPYPYGFWDDIDSKID